MTRPTLVIQIVLWLLLALCLNRVIAVEQEVQDTVQLLSPTECQVFQQDDAGRAEVQVRLKAEPEPYGMQVRFVITGGGRGETTGWTELAQEEEGIYQADVPVVAGGWYELWHRADGQGEGQRLLERMGVGEVFITAGQSNAGNHGHTRQAAADDRVVSYHAGTWAHARDPMPGTTGDGGSIWPILGDMLVRNLQVPVGFACVAVGGSASSYWLPPATGGYGRLLTILGELEAGGARAILWHQGESDSMGLVSAEQYYSNLCSTIEQLPADAGWCPPWVVAGQAGGVGKGPLGGQQMLWRDGIALEGPLTEDLYPPLFRPVGDSHFNEYGMIAHAQRWFAMLWAQFYANVPLVMPEQ